MGRIRFLSVKALLFLHRRSIQLYGGSPEIRDLGLLESAAAQPAVQFGGAYLHEDVPAMAAAYLFHIAKNHPFVDGNKRTAALAAFTFLKVNNWDTTATETAFQDLTLRVAAGEASKEDAVAFFREHARPNEGAGTEANGAAQQE
jgi:death-on-curing protein